MIIQRLLSIQHRVGYLPEEDLVRLAEELQVPLCRIEEVSSFYPTFRREWNKPANLEVKVCQDMTCHLYGAADLLDPRGLPAVAAMLTTKKRMSIRVSSVSCLGRCDRAPVIWVEPHPTPPHEHPWVFCGRKLAGFENLLHAFVNGETHASPDLDRNYEVLSNADLIYSPTIRKEAKGSSEPGVTLSAPDWEINCYRRDSCLPTYNAVRRITDNILAKGVPTQPPTSLEGKDLDRFVENNNPFLFELRTSGLLGMGGAGAPAYTKWLDVWRQPGPEKYIVANGDESEPGTFKDRELMLRFPHLVVEGVILGGLLTGASAGYIYVRHEYQEQIQALKDEIDRATRLGACGVDINQSGISFTVEVFESPGGYICGEQSALLEAMENRRSQPRNRPPELGTNGLWDKPTIVNNVETLAWTPFIVLQGGANYSGFGWKVPTNTEIGFGGKRLLSVSGDVNRSGVFEVPVGLPLGELILSSKYCGGIKGKQSLKAIATSGPSGGLLPRKLPVDSNFWDRFPETLQGIRDRSPADAELMNWFIQKYLPRGKKYLDVLSIPLDLNFFRQLASVLRLPVEPMLGAGLVVYAEGSDVLDHVVNFTRFYRNESCGKCVPCRIGSQKLFQLGTELIAKRNSKELSKTYFEEVKSDVLEISRAMQQTSICGLGYVAPIPMSTALVYFPEDVVRNPIQNPEPQR